MAYATVAVLKAEINLVSASDDATLTRLLDAATRAIDRFCNRPDGFEADVIASARYYAGRGKPYELIGECVEISTVAVKDSATDTAYTAWTSPTTSYAGDGDWIPCTGDPTYPEFGVLPYTMLLTDPNGDYASFTSGRFSHRHGFRPTSTVSRGIPTVEVTARWGYSVLVPDDIEEACVMIAARWYKRLQSGQADTLASGELGQLLYTMKIDPDVALILTSGRYKVPVTGRR